MYATLLFSNLFSLTLQYCTAAATLCLLNIRWKIVPYLSSERNGGEGGRNKRQRERERMG